MKHESKGLNAVYVAILLTFVACASQQPLVTIEPAKGEIVLSVKASNFSFEPNNIKVFIGDVIVLKIENISDSGHNFTIKDPQGNTLQNVALPSKETVTVKVPISKEGTYEFYCDKPFHRGLGMKGQIIVSKEP